MTIALKSSPDVSLTRLRSTARGSNARARALLEHSARVDRGQLVARLREQVRGDVLDDAGSLGLMAQDASNYFQVPLAVVTPRSREDVIAALGVCRELGAPITCRTGGTGLAGQTCNHAVIFDFSRYMTRVLEVDAAARRARVEPGVICDDLIKRIQQHGLTFGPKPATHDRCCFGGMIANNCGGMEAQMGGTAVWNVESLEVLLYDGTQLQLGWMSEHEFAQAAQRPGREGQIFSALRELREHNEPLIRERFPEIPRRVSGYNLDQLLPSRSRDESGQGRINAARLLVGTEGTCAVILSAELRLLPLPAQQTVICVGFADVFQAADAVPKVLEYEPLVCEGIDQRLIDHICRKGSRQERYLSILPKGTGFLLIRLGADSRQALMSKARDMCQALQAEPYGAVDAQTYTDEAEQEALWQIRESGLGATAFVPGQPDAWPGWEDSAVAPEQLGDYLRDLSALFDKYDYHPAMYGHFGQGLLHCRVSFDLQSAGGVRDFRTFLQEAAQLCVHKYRGSLSGEHGDGQARGALLEIMFGSELVQAFRQFKAIWDPDGLMNPGKLIDAAPVDANLRLGASYDPAQPATHFQFPDDQGSFARATLRCVGVGKCRRTSADGKAPDDTMCPSYMVTRDEKHCTRGRAHLLWEMLRGGDSPIEGGFRNEHVKQSLDLCLACKGCKSDCPVNVDMATYKAEFLSHYYARRLRPRQAYAFGLIDKWARLASLAPGLVNLITHAQPTAGLAKWLGGIAHSRELPRFAPETFVHWFRRRPATPSGTRERVVLWPDTFNNHFHTQTARAAVEVLEAAGFEVVVPELPMCCGRPLYDYGFMELAKRYLERVLEGLAPYIEAGLPIVVLEPSCASVFRDELQNLMPGRPAARRLRDQTKLLSELLVERAVALPALQRDAIVQGHCHHKSVLGFDAEQQVWQRMHLNAELLSSGCCGMAGSFGFEADPDKQRVANACGERVLFEAVRKAPEQTLIIADGFSCRTQLRAGTARRGMHLADVIQLALRPGSEPDAARERARERAPERLALAGLVCVAAGVWFGVKAFAAQRAMRLGA